MLILPVSGSLWVPDRKAQASVLKPSAGAPTQNRPIQSPLLPGPPETVTVTEVPGSMAGFACAALAKARTKVSVRKRPHESLRNQKRQPITTPSESATALMHDSG